MKQKWNELKKQSKIKNVKRNDAKKTYPEAKQKILCEIKLFFVDWSEKKLVLFQAKITFTIAKPKI